MISAVRGRVVLNQTDGLTALAVGPITLELLLPISQSLALRQGEEAELHTYLHFASASDQLKLFGFTDTVSRELFVTLIGGSGVGPRVALALLELGPAGLIAAVRDGDEQTLTSVKGVGPKLAKKIILELSDKVSREFSHVAEAGGRDEGSLVADDAVQAVVALGFTRIQAEQAFAKVSKEQAGDDTATLIRRMLAQLSNG